jgi:hypothetical protein
VGEGAELALGRSRVGRARIAPSQILELESKRRPTRRSHVSAHLVLATGLIDFLFRDVRRGSPKSLEALMFLKASRYVFYEFVCLFV